MLEDAEEGPYPWEDGEDWGSLEYRYLRWTLNSEYRREWIETKRAEDLEDSVGELASWLDHW